MLSGHPCTICVLTDEGEEEKRENLRNSLSSSPERERDAASSVHSALSGLSLPLQPSLGTKTMPGMLLLLLLLHPSFLQISPGFSSSSSLAATTNFDEAISMQTGREEEEERRSLACAPFFFLPFLSPEMLLLLLSDSSSVCAGGMGGTRGMGSFVARKEEEDPMLCSLGRMEWTITIMQRTRTRSRL